MERERGELSIFGGETPILIFRLFGNYRMLDQMWLRFRVRESDTCKKANFFWKYNIWEIWESLHYDFQGIIIFW